MGKISAENERYRNCANLFNRKVLLTCLAPQSNSRSNAKQHCGTLRKTLRNLAVILWDEDFQITKKAFRFATKGFLFFRIDSI